MKHVEDCGHGTASGQVSSLQFLDQTQTRTQLYRDILAAEQLNSWIAKYSSIA